jgi:hypothetical protein
MKKKEFLFGFQAVLMALALVLAGCPADDENNGGDEERIYIRVEIFRSDDLVDNHPSQGAKPATSMLADSTVAAIIKGYYLGFPPVQDQETIKYEWYINDVKIEGATGMKLDASKGITVVAGEKIKAKITVTGTVAGNPLTTSAYSQEVSVIAATNG